jgi:tetratricopeptide (TPR) repeat protein
LALLSNNQYEEAYEAYNKAIQLEPTNDGYKQNLKIVEEKLKTMSFTAGAATAGAVIILLLLLLLVLLC